MDKISQNTYFVRYLDADGFTWTRGALQPGDGQTLSQFTLENIQERIESGDVTILEVKNLEEGPKC